MAKAPLIGLTGQTGAGKTSVSDIMREAGIAVIDADAVVHHIYANNWELLADLSLHFGVTILNVDGTLNRRRLGNIVFNDKAKLAELERIIFPFVLAEVNRRVDALRRSGERLVVLDAPTLYESGADAACDAVIAVTAPCDLRLNRIIVRDHLTDEEARARMRSQPDASFYTGRCDYNLINDGDEAELERKTRALITELLTAH